MTRQTRPQSLTEVYHVIQRGLDRMALFHDEDDKQMFLNLLKFQVSDAFKIYGYCLMDNHVHLMAKSSCLSSNIQRIASVYALWFNQKYQRIGYLFQDRFKSEAIENESYFLSCLRYILQNPVKAGICDKASSYRWNSYRAYFNASESFVQTKFIHRFFDSKKDFDEYLSIFEDEVCPEIECPRKPTDNEVRQILQQKLNGKTFSDLSPSEKKQLLKEIKDSAKAGLRQLARITKTGYSIIRRL